MAQVNRREHGLRFFVQSGGLEQLAIGRARARCGHSQPGPVGEGGKAGLDIPNLRVGELDDAGIAHLLERHFGHIRFHLRQQQFVGRQPRAQQAVQGLLRQLHVRIGAQTLGGGRQCDQPRVPAGGTIEHGEILALGILSRLRQLRHLTHVRREVDSEAPVFRRQRLQGSGSDQIQSLPRLLAQLVQRLGE